VSPAKRLNRSDGVRDVDSGGPNEPRIGRGPRVQISTRKGAILTATMARSVDFRPCPTVDIPQAADRGQHRYGADADWGVLDGVHIGATWPIHLNRPCAAVMWP